MSEPEDIIEREGGAFRTSANEDPHGTRATAMALSPSVQRSVSEPQPVLGTLIVGAAHLGAAVLILRNVLAGTMSTLEVVPLALFAVTILVGAWWRRSAPRLQFTSHVLRVIQRGKTRTIPWRDVEQVEVTEMAVRVSVLVNGRLETIVAPLPQVGRKAAHRLSRLPAPIFVGGPDVELARGSRIAIAVAAASVGAILAAFGTWVGVAIGHDAIGWMVGLGLLYLAMTAWTLARSRVIARSSGLWVNGKLIPWPAIEDAQAGNAQGKERTSQVRVRIADMDELTVSVGADAERAVEEIRRRRDLARDEVARQKHPERAQSTPR